MRGQIVWKMRRYKYPTINTDTYTLNEEGRKGREEEDGNDGWGGGEEKGMIDHKKRRV